MMMEFRSVSLSLFGGGGGQILDYGCCGWRQKRPSLRRKASVGGTAC